MTGARSGNGAPSHEEIGPEGAARSHARRVLGRDPRARDDVEPGAEVTPPDLVDWLLGRTFHAFELVAHAAYQRLEAVDDELHGRAQPDPVDDVWRWAAAIVGASDDWYAGEQIRDPPGKKGGRQAGTEDRDRSEGYCLDHTDTFIIERIQKKPQA